MAYRAVCCVYYFQELARAVRCVPHNARWRGLYVLSGINILAGIEVARFGCHSLTPNRRFFFVKSSGRCGKKIQLQDRDANGKKADSVA